MSYTIHLLNYKFFHFSQVIIVTDQDDSQEAACNKLEQFEPLGNIVNELFDSGSLTDLVLAASTGEQFGAHKLVLAARSPVFKNMFEVDMAQQDNRVKLNDLSAPVMKAMLRFIYTGKVDLVDHLAKDLLVVSDKVNLDVCFGITTLNFIYFIF